jgi:uncharacterized protein
MTSLRFTRHVLRTTDVPAAQAFYDAVLGQRGDGIVPLPAQALARGARPHWLGLIGAGSEQALETLAGGFVERGATRLGPEPPAPIAVLRDVGGAIVGVDQGAGPSAAGVVWQVLETVAPKRSFEAYLTLCGWALTERVSIFGHGTFQQFAFAQGETSVGSIGDIADRPSVHPHWLFFFGVPELGAALGRVRAHGGAASHLTALPDGRRVGVCEDAQGAAFGLMEV